MRGDWGAFVIPTWCKACLHRVWVWLGMRTSQLCCSCFELTFQGLHAFELVVFESGDSRGWDHICVRCGLARNWRGEDPPCQPRGGSS